MNARIKVLFVIDHFRDPHAGTEGQLFQLVSNLDLNAVQPHLLLFSDSPYIQQHGFPCPYTVLGRTRLASPLMWFVLLRLAWGFRQQGYRLAHIFFNDPSIICPPVFRLAGIRSIISRRDMGYWYTPAITRVLQLTGRFVTMVLANSAAVAALTAEKERIPAERIQVIYNGYPSDTIARDEPPSQLVELKARGTFLVGLVANIRPIKRIADLVEAVALLAEKCPRLNLVLIGSGDPSALQQLASARAVEDRVHFLGPRSDVRNCLDYFDIAVLCSESEGFSNAIIEYMQAALPVVCTATGGNPEAVKHNVTGYLYPVGDISALAGFIDRLYRDEEHRLTMGQRARAEAAGAYGIDKMVQAHQSVYTGLCRADEVYR